MAHKVYIQWTEERHYVVVFMLWSLDHYKTYAIKLIPLPIYMHHNFQCSNIYITKAVSHQYDDHSIHMSTITIVSLQYYYLQLHYHLSTKPSISLLYAPRVSRLPASI